MDNSLSRTDKQQSDLERYLDCSEVRLRVDSCKIDKYTKDINIMVVNESQMDLPDFILSILGKTYDGDAFNQNILFSKKLKKGENAFLTTLDSVTILDDSNIEDLDVRKIDQISLGNQRCNNLFISDLNCEIVDNLEDHLVAYYSLDQEDLIYNELEGSEWSNSTAYGRQSGTSYFQKNGDVITGTTATGTWLGPSILYSANKKTKYNIKAEFNVLAGSNGRIGYHLYKDGVLVDYDVPTDTQGMFTLYHPTGLYNYKSFSLTTHKIDTIIDLSSAPDFDSINLAFLVGSPTTITTPTIVFNVNSVSVSEVLVEDLSGYENHGEIVGTTFTEDQKGKANGAMLFNGTSDYLFCGSNPLVTIGDPFTILLWSKTESITSTYNRLFSLATSVEAFGVGISNSSSYLGYYYGSSNHFARIKTEFTPPFNEWAFFTLRFVGGSNTNNDNYNNYNNALEINKISSGTFSSSNNETVIGGRIVGTTPGFFHKGAISIVKIYNKALTDKEIRAIYNETRTN